MILFSPRARVAGLVPLLVVLGAPITFGQVVTGAIWGRITDTTGSVVPGATVQVPNLDTGF